MPVPLNSVCSFFYRFYAAVSCPEVPLSEKFDKDISGWSFIDLLKGLPDHQCFHGFQVKSTKLNFFKTLGLPFIKVTSVFKKEVFGVFKNRIFSYFCLTNFVNSIVEDFGDMESIKHYGRFRQVFFDTEDKGRGHITRDLTDLICIPIMGYEIVYKISHHFIVSALGNKHGSFLHQINK